MMWEGSVDLVNYQCQQLLGDRFHRLDVLLPKLVDIDGVDQMDLLCEVAKQADLQPACQWLDAHFMRELAGREKERHAVSADPWACGVCVLYVASAQSLNALDQEGDGVTVTISRADLARRTREAIKRARRGQAVLVESYGGQQVAIMDALDYHLLRAMATYRSQPGVPADCPETMPRGLAETAVQERVAAARGDVQEAWNVIMAAYLDGEISLGRAAALLGIERLNLRARLNRLGFPDRQGRQNALGTHAEYVAL
jgi:hypothetical protein